MLRVKFLFIYIFIINYCTAQDMPTFKAFLGQSAFSKPLMVAPDYSLKNKNPVEYSPSLFSLTSSFHHKRQKHSYFEAGLNLYQMKKSYVKDFANFERINAVSRGTVDFSLNYHSGFIQETKFIVGIGYGASVFYDKTSSSMMSDKSDAYTRIFTGITPLITPKIQYWLTNRLFFEAVIPVRVLWFGMSYDKDNQAIGSDNKWRSGSLFESSFGAPRFFHVGIGYQYKEDPKAKKERLKRAKENQLDDF